MRRADDSGVTDSLHHRASPPVLSHGQPFEGQPGVRAAGLLALVAVIAVVVGVAIQQTRATAPSNPPPPTAVSQKLTARGQIRPVGQARVGTIGGGVLNRLVVEVGDVVNDQQELARVRGLEGTEVVTSPLRGTVTAVLAHLGDTLAPGATIATVADLSRLQVETNDVDEFLITHVRRDQPVAVFVEALEQTLQGRVRTVSLQPITTPAGDEHYPVAIDLLDAHQSLRLGMSVRLRFSE